MKKNIFRGIGLVIAVSSILTLMDPLQWYNHLPMIFGIGCIIYILADKYSD